MRLQSKTALFIGFIAVSGGLGFIWQVIEIMLDRLEALSEVQYFHALNIDRIDQSALTIDRLHAEFTELAQTNDVSS